MYINKGAAKTGSALQLVDKVDKLLDGDAGSRQLTDVRRKMQSIFGSHLSPPVPPLLLKTGGNTCVSAGFRL